MTVDETLKLIAQQWCNLSDLMKLANIGRNSALTIKSKIKNDLEKEGYYCDNENWEIEYDINFHYLIDEILTDDGTYYLMYSKGRITKLTDEFGNSANYDFKHRLFKHTSDPNNRKTWFYTFNRTKT